MREVKKDYIFCSFQKFFQYLLSLFEVLLECVGEPLGILDKLPFALFQRLLRRRGGDHGGDLVDGVKKLLDGTRDFPEKETYMMNMNV